MLFAADPHFLVDMLEVGMHGAGLDMQRSGDLVVAEAAAGAGGDLLLAPGEGLPQVDLLARIRLEDGLAQQGRRHLLDGPVEQAGADRQAFGGVAIHGQQEPVEVFPAQVAEPLLEGAKSVGKRNCHGGHR